MTWLRDNNTHLIKSTSMFAHPITGMKYREVDGEYYFFSRWRHRGELRWIKSGMKTGFIPITKSK
jgi:hypothetical protein